MAISNRLLQRAGFALLALSLVLGGIFFWLLANAEQYTVYADGSPIVVRGQFETVGEVVRAAGLRVGPDDRLNPHPDAAASPSVPIALNRAREVLLTAGGQSERHATGQPTIGAFLAEIGFPLRRTTQILADGRPVSVYDIGRSPLPTRLEIRQLTTATVIDGERQTTITSGRPTVGEALQEAGFTLYAADGSDPPLSSWLEPDMTIVIQRAIPLQILADGQVVPTRSRHRTVMSVLAEAGIGLVGLDYTRPGPDVLLQTNDTIEVIRVTEDFQTIDTEIPFENSLQATDQLEIDQRAVLQAGVPGLKRVRLRIRYENGVEVGRQPDGEWVVREPAAAIVGYGTRLNIRTVDTPDGPLEYWRVVRMRVTAYTPQSAGKPKSSPGYGITASGVKAGYGVVAIDPRVVPFRSYVYVPGYGRAFAGDTGGGVKGRWIDLGYPDGQIKAWSGYVDVYYLTPVPEKINYLIPTVLP